LDENLPSKRYEPVVVDLENKNHSHTLIIESTGFNKSVLEIGTSTGYLSKILKERGNRVTGIEIDQEASSIAQQYCDPMIVGDIELLNLEEIFKTVSFDVIICGDVLEHLKKPATVLKKLRKFLKPEGYLVVSLPNFCHGDVLLNLLNGDFHYTSIGLLDETHLHFFGLKNIYSIFTDCGYQIKDMHTTNLDIGTTELRIDNTKIPRDLLQFIRSLPNSTVYQYIFRAYPSDNEKPSAIGETDITRLFSDSLQESRLELQAPLKAKVEELIASTKTLTGSLSLKETQVHDLTESLSLKETQVHDLTESLSLKETQVYDLTESLSLKETQVYDLTESLSLKETQVQNITAQLNEREQKLSAIETSIVWQFTMKFHNKIVERLLPHKSRRRKYYDLWRTGGKILINDGYHAFSQSAIRHFYKTNELSNYQNWIQQNEPEPDKLILLKNTSQNFSYRPKISIITPVWNTDKKWLRLAIDSVINQVYDNWELCIVDGGSTKRYIKHILREYSQKDSRIKIKILEENTGIAGNSNEALSLATGEFIGFLDHDDELAPFALHEVVSLLNQNQHFEFIYSDEDKMDQNGNRKDPFFKPDWSPDLFLSQNYLCHLSLIRKTLIDSVGGFHTGYDGSQDYDLFLRCTEKISPATIAHIPKILYHWRIISGSAADHPEAKPYAITSAKKALDDALIRRELQGEAIDGLFSSSYRVCYTIQDDPHVSIIIPTKDHVDVLKRCIQSILDKTLYKNYEIVIVDNQSTDRETFEYYKSLATNPKIKILYYDNPFNFSAINNYAVTRVQSPYILFLNNDTEVISEEWLSAMLEHAQRDSVGAVGAKLLYPNNLIQHAGVILGITGTPGQKGVAGHSHKYLPENCSGHFVRPQIIGNCSAVTAACMMMRKDVFNEIGGFNKDLAIAFNDVDLCLRIRKAGYLIIYTPYSLLYHHESMSRGYENTPEKQARFLNEVTLIRKQWGAVIDNGDPYYNPNLTLEREDFSIKNK
jgi:O-antigen biosynthesis protein